MADVGNGNPVPHQLREAIINPASSEPTVREFLSWFGSERRLPKTVSAIRAAMDALKIETNPDFEFAYLDSPIKLVAKHTSSPPVAAVVVGADTNRNQPVVSEPWADPTYRIGKLPAANRRPIIIKPESSLSEAITIMLQFDYSQLPVMSGERDIKGAVSWQSIGACMGLGRSANKVSDVLEHAPEVRYEDSLFDTIGTIERYGYVLVRAVDKRIVGIVTATDVTAQFRTLTEPFILIGEIENYVRRLLDGRFTASELKQFVDPKRKSPDITRISDLTFGEYIRLLDDQVNWNRVEIRLDKLTFLKALQEVREIRNDVMHFDPDGLAPKHLDALRSFVGLLQRLAKIGVIIRTTVA